MYYMTSVYVGTCILLTMPIDKIPFLLISDTQKWEETTLVRRVKIGYQEIGWWNMWCTCKLLFATRGRNSLKSSSSRRTVLLSKIYHCHCAFLKKMWFCFGRHSPINDTSKVKFSFPLITCGLCTFKHHANQCCLPSQHKAIPHSGGISLCNKAWVVNWLSDSKVLYHVPKKIDLWVQQGQPNTHCRMFRCIGHQKYSSIMS